jgi:hypothetical protein
MTRGYPDFCEQNSFRCDNCIGEVKCWIWFDETQEQTRWCFEFCEISQGLDNKLKLFWLLLRTRFYLLSVSLICVLFWSIMLCSFYCIQVSIQFVPNADSYILCVPSMLSAPCKTGLTKSFTARCLHHLATTSCDLNRYDPFPSRKDLFHTKQTYVCR